MVVTKKKKSKHNKTRKVTNFATCPTEVQPFEHIFGQTISKKNLLMDNEQKTRLFVKQIIANQSCVI